MKCIGITLLPLAMLCIGGCCLSGTVEDTRPLSADGVRLNRIPGTSSVDIPAGVTDKQALDAVESAIAGTRSGNHKNEKASQWRTELRDPENKWIRVGFTVRKHYLQICYRIEGAKLVPDVPYSMNLKQEGIKIHRKVPNWINSLNILITQQLYVGQNDTAHPDRR